MSWALAPIRRREWLVGLTVAALLALVLPAGASAAAATPQDGLLAIASSGGIDVIPATGGPARLVDPVAPAFATFPSYTPGAAAFSPNGRWLAISEWYGQTPRIFLVRADGAKGHVLWTEPSSALTGTSPYFMPALEGPQFGPDGESIAFTVGGNATRPVSPIVDLDIATSVKRVLAAIPSNSPPFVSVTGGEEFQFLTPTQPALSVGISPDFRYAAFAAPGPFVSSLTILNLATGRRTRVSVPPSANGNGFSGIAWSITDVVAFGVGGSIYTVQLNGRDPRMVASAGDSVPEWSPDGSRISFVRDLNTNCGSQWCDVKHTLDVISSQGGRRQVVWPSGFLGSDVWSPDGRQIAVNTSNGVYVRDLATGGSKLVARGDLALAWQRRPG